MNERANKTTMTTTKRERERERERQTDRQTEKIEIKTNTTTKLTIFSQRQLPLMVFLDCLWIKVFEVWLGSPAAWL